MDRLYTQFHPISYTLDLTMHRTERRFEGSVEVIGTLPSNATTIMLHAKDLQISEASIDGKGVSYKSHDDGLTLTHDAELSAGEHRVSVVFSGTITDPMHGLYPCYFTLDGEKKELLATQFESHHAREVFPCIDEPEAKATFTVTLHTEDGITVLGNMPIVSQETNDTWLVTTFDTTPKMSTYLLAWVVGPLAYLEATSAKGTRIRAYATPDKVKQTAFALETAVRTLDFYDEYFALPYPLPKCDMVGLPDFSSGAMENWGLITFRESMFLVDDKNTSPGMKQAVATTVAHELAHQWFGNLVTMRWWDDLWLNESFANWIEYLAIDSQQPNWQLWTQFFDNETMRALSKDSLKNVQSVQQSVHDPEEIRTLFDPAIVYAKGASLLHMLSAYIGHDAFRDGLRQYMAKHQYTNTETKDLWGALSAASNKDVAAFMQPWLTQPGHPVVEVTQKAETLALHQQRFFSNPKEYAEPDASLWPVPLLCDQVDETLFADKEAALSYTKTDAPLLLNKDRSGFYILSYDAEHTARLAEAVRAKQLSVTDRLGLLADAFDLTHAGRQSTVQLATLLQAYATEDSQPVWGAISDALGALKLFTFDNDALREKVQRLSAIMAEDQYRRLGWEPRKDEPYFDQLLRPIVIGHMCYSERKDIIQHALMLFNAAKQPEDIFSDIRGSIFAVAAKFGGKKALTTLLDWYHATTSAQVRIQLTAGITAVREPESITHVLDLITTDAVKLQDVFYWIAYLSRNRFARQLLWQWTTTHWQWIKDNFSADMSYDEFPQYSSSLFYTKEGLESFKEFFLPKLEEPALVRAIHQGIESIESTIAWIDRDREAVEEYLNKIV